MDAQKTKKREPNVKNMLWKAQHRNNGVEFDVDLNPRHTTYYKLQLPFLVDEWGTFTDVLRKPLPSTFRISSRVTPSLDISLQQKLQRLNQSIQQKFIEHEGRVITEKSEGFVRKIAWLPSTYQSLTDNRFIAHSSGLADLHNFLTQQTLAGYIVRQELASMIPVRLLDPQHHHRVLDVCGAPGSKTEQILAQMTDSYRNSSLSSVESLSAKEFVSPYMTGMLVANDADPKRLGTLMDRFQNFPSANIVFTCLDGSTLSSSFPPGFTFDRIVCDVPCSGDGTFRKCPHLYRLFRPRYSLELHPIQLRILCEALSILEVGGRLVYSTCSLNPIEDEAVVSAALRRFSTSNLQLLQPQPLIDKNMPGLQFRAGVTSWRSDEEVFLVGEEDASERSRTLKRILPLPVTIPAPYLSSEMSPSEQAEERRIIEQLPRCIRIVPQDQDTGGFFVAVFQKTAPFSTVAVDQSALSIPSAAANIDLEEEGEDLYTAASAMKQLGYNPKDAAKVSAKVAEKSLLAISAKVSLNGFEVDAPQLKIETVSQARILIPLQSANPVSSAGLRGAEKKARDEFVSFDVSLNCESSDLSNKSGLSFVEIPVADKGMNPTNREDSKRSGADVPNVINTLRLLGKETTDLVSTLHTQSKSFMVTHAIVDLGLSLGKAVEKEGTAPIYRMIPSPQSVQAMAQVATLVNASRSSAIGIENAAHFRCFLQYLLSATNSEDSANAAFFKQLTMRLLLQKSVSTSCRRWVIKGMILHSETIFLSDDECFLELEVENSSTNSDSRTNHRSDDATARHGNLHLAQLLDASKGALGSTAVVPNERLYDGHLLRVNLLPAPLASTALGQSAFLSDPNTVGERGSNPKKRKSRAEQKAMKKLKVDGQVPSSSTNGITKIIDSDPGHSSKIMPSIQLLAFRSALSETEGNLDSNDVREVDIEVLMLSPEQTIRAILDCVK